MVEDVARLGVLAEHDMGRHDVHAARDRPGVEVVDVDHARSLADVSLDVAELDPLRGGLEEDVNAVAEEDDGPRDDQDRDDQ